ncbi:MAG: hypothetical protein JW726_06450, partial [Anaerolineales bacterium]|nr:hypothetical protein [Anaerolineales bacterium]
MTWRRVESEFEADLYKVPPPRFFLFRGSVGEAEVKRYSSGEARLEVKFYGLKVPDGTTVSVLIDGALVTEMPIRRQRGYLDETAPESER